MVSFSHMATSLVLLLWTLVRMLVALPIKDCGYDRFYKENLEACIPCDDICYEGSWSDCERLCKAYYLTLTECSFDKYWDETLEGCVECELVCDPISREDCRARCKRFIVQNTTPPTNVSTYSTTPKTPNANNNKFKTVMFGLLITMVVALFLVFTGIPLVTHICRCKYKGKKKTILLSNGEE